MKLENKKSIHFPFIKRKKLERKAKATELGIMKEVEIN